MDKTGSFIYIDFDSYNTLKNKLESYFEEDFCELLVIEWDKGVALEENFIEELYKKIENKKNIL